MVIVWIKDINDQFCKVFLFYSFVVITSVKLIQFEICDRFCIPYTQCIYYMVTISNNWHVIRNGHNRLIIFLNEYVFTCSRVFLKTDISTKTYFFRVLFTANFKWISFFQPVVRNLHLISIFDFLFEHSITVTDSTSICRIVQCCKRIKETCCKTSKTTISKSRIRLLVFNHVQINIHLFQCFFYIFICCHIDEVVAKCTSHKELH